MRSISTIFVFLSLFVSAPVLAVDVDGNIFRAGHAYEIVRMRPSDPFKCAALCTEDEKCRSFNYIKPTEDRRAGQCMLYDDVHGAWRSKCCLSGIKHNDADGPVTTFEDIELEDVIEGVPAASDEPSADGAVQPQTRVKTYALDLCQRFGEECGFPAATAFCRSKGFEKAVDFLIKRGVPPTMSIGDRRLCNGQFCHRIDRIDCVGEIEAVPEE